MKNRWLHKTLTLGMFVMLMAGMGHAQYLGQIYKVKIPFNFSVEGQRFAPGDYTFKCALQHTLQLRNERGAFLANIATNSVESRNVPDAMKLVFNVYNGQHFLAQIWSEGNAIGNQVIKSSVEMETAKYTAEKPVIRSFATGYH
jgi:hypothetical protein